MGCSWLQELACRVGTISLKCFCLGIEVGLWIEMVMSLNLSVVGARVLETFQQIGVLGE